MKLQLYYPVKPLYITQKFGETAFLPYYNANGIHFKGHNGIDMVAHHGEPIYASHDGVAYYEIDSGQGHGVVIRSNEQFEYNGGLAYFKTIYWHMCDSIKEPKYKSPIEGHSIDGEGIAVKAGDLIGYADTTGLSSGDHLHFGLKPQAQEGEPSFTWYNLAQDNGYTGAIDPQPYFNGIFAVDINASVYRFDNNLRYGMKNNDVQNLQKVLRKIGYDSYFTLPYTTNFYGKETQAAVLAFQQDKGVVIVGIESLFGFYCGAKTRKVLNDAKVASP